MRGTLINVVVALVTVLCVLALLLWWREMPTTTQREAFLRERIAYLEEVLELERRSCQQAHEMSDRAAALVRDTMGALGVSE